MLKLTLREKNLILRGEYDKILYASALSFIKEIAMIEKVGIREWFEQEDLMKQWLDIFEYYDERKFYYNCYEYCEKFKKEWENRK